MSWQVQDCDSGGRSLASSDPATRCNNNISASLSLQVSHHKSGDSAWPSSETPSVSEAQQGHGYGTSHHCSPLDLELGMSLSTTPSIGTQHHQLPWSSIDWIPKMLNKFYPQGQVPTILLLNLIDSHGDSVVDKSLESCNIVSCSHPLYGHKHCAYLQCYHAQYSLLHQQNFLLQRCIQCP